MSYPAIRFAGATGESSARYRSGAAGPDVVYPDGTRVHYLAGVASTGGLFGLYLWEMGPNRGGPGPHFHRTIAESFFILSGTMRIYDGRSWMDTSPGDFIHVPPGGIHGFRNESAEPASMLIHFAPGAPRESYFEGLAARGVSWNPSDEELADFFLRHDNHWV